VICTPLFYTTDINRRDCELNPGLLRPSPAHIPLGNRATLYDWHIQSAITSTCFKKPFSCWLWSMLTVTEILLVNRNFWFMYIWYCLTFLFSLDKLVTSVIYLFFIYYEIRTTGYANKNTMWKKRKYTKIHKVHICLRATDYLSGEYMVWQWRNFDVSWLSPPSCGQNSDKCFSPWYRWNTLVVILTFS